MPPPRTRALAGQSVVLDHDVPELRPAAEEPPDAITAKTPSAAPTNIRIPIPMLATRVTSCGPKNGRRGASGTSGISSAGTSMPSFSRTACRLVTAISALSKPDSNKASTVASSASHEVTARDTPAAPPPPVRVPLAPALGRASLAGEAAWGSLRYALARGASRSRFLGSKAAVGTNPISPPLGAEFGSSE